MVSFKPTLVFHVAAMYEHTKPKTRLSPKTRFKSPPNTMELRFMCFYHLFQTRPIISGSKAGFGNWTGNRKLEESETGQESETWNRKLAGESETGGIGNWSGIRNWESEIDEGLEN